MMSTIFVVLFFSGGIPALYGIAFIFFAMTYVGHKILLLNYYKRTDTTLHRSIVIVSI